jgi:hypothetical protein
MEYSGFAAQWDQIVYRGDPATRKRSSSGSMRAFP